MSSSRPARLRRRERAVAQIEIVAARFEINDDIAARQRCPYRRHDTPLVLDPGRHKTQAADHQARPQLQTRPAPRPRLPTPAPCGADPWFELACGPAGRSRSETVDLT
jgi:hypothetical protein